MNFDPQNLVKDSITDLSQRWKKAREAALKTVSEDWNHEDQFLEKELNSPDEEIFEQILKQVFLKSRSLGISYQKKFNVVWELTDLSQHLSRMGSPCLQGKWTMRDSAFVLSRPGCAAGIRNGLRYCQYWREAVDGLVMGLCEEERFARHSCVNAGDQACEDVFYQENNKPHHDANWKNQFRWGPIPNEKKETLKIIQQKFQAMNVNVTFLGLSERKLFYKMDSKEVLSCGGSGTTLRNQLESLICQSWSEVQLQDASPLAVYGERA